MRQETNSTDSRWPGQIDPMTGAPLALAPSPGVTEGVR